MKSMAALVGMKHRGTEKVVAALPKGHPLLLVREPDNKFDPFAIQVWANDQHVGYVKASQARALSRKLDMPTWHQRSHVSGQPCINAILQIDGGRWPLVEFDE